MDDNSKQKIFMDCLNPIYARLARYARALTRNKEDAKDLISETILKAYESFEKVKNIEAFTSYLFSIAYRIHKRQNWRKRIWGVWDEKSAEQIPTNSNPELQADVGYLYDALAKLPFKMKEAVILFEISGFSLKEVAEIQKTNVSTVKTRLKRGREKLAILLNVEQTVLITINEENNTKKNGKSSINILQNIEMRYNNE